MPDNRIDWASAEVGVSPNGLEYVLKVEHDMDERVLTTFLLILHDWLGNRLSVGPATVNSESWKPLAPVGNSSTRYKVGTLLLTNVGLLDLDPDDLRVSWSAMAKEAAEEVKARKEAETPRLAAFGARLRAER